MLVAQPVTIRTPDGYLLASFGGSFLVTAIALVDIPVEAGGDDDATFLSYTTFSAFSLQVLKAAFPSMIGERSKPLFDLALVNGLIKAQRFIDCLRKTQVTFYPKSNFFEQCGIATVQSPRGRLNAIYAFKPNEDCTKYFYRPVTPQYLTCWAKENSCHWQDAPKGVDGNDYNAASDNCVTTEDLHGTEDDTCFIVAEKVYARGQNGEIYMAPRPPCGYVVAVHWEGLRRAWAATDPILDDSDLRDWLVAYVRGEITLRIDSDRMIARAMKVLAQEKFADLMFWCNEERRIQLELDCGSGLDTGSLTQMFAPIYPYECVEPEPEVEVGNEAQTATCADIGGNPDGTASYTVAANTVTLTVPESEVSATQAAVNATALQQAIDTLTQMVADGDATCDPEPQDPDTDNLVLWLKADSYDIPDGTLIGGDGLKWINQAPAYAGSDMDMDIEAKQPSFRADVIGSMPAVQFDDSVGKWMYINPGFSDAGATFNGGWTLMVVLKQSAASPGITPGPFFADSSAILVAPHFFLTSAGVLRFKFGVTAILSSANYDAPTPIASPYDTLHFLTVTWKPEDGKFYFRNNKTDLGSADLDYSILEPYNIGLGCIEIGIGSFRDGGTWYSSWYNGYLCEMLLYKVPIEAVTLDTLYDDYFKPRWVELP